MPPTSGQPDSSARTSLDIPTIPPSSRPTSAHLRPEDAYHKGALYLGSSGVSTKSPPPISRNIRKASPLGNGKIAASASINSNSADALVGGRTRLRSESRRPRDGASRKRGTWKKLLWVKQAYPDNYTDELQFLSHLQRNPRLRPYEFWPLVADSTIIVQHVASVIIFVCCFIGIFQERVSPISVVSWATTGTVLGWILRDFWIGREEVQKAGEKVEGGTGNTDHNDAPEDRPADIVVSTANNVASGPSSDSLGISFAAAGTGTSTRMTSRATSTASISAFTDTHTPRSSTPTPPKQAQQSPPDSPSHPVDSSPPADLVLPTRNSERLATAKSAILIYCALLGLSPILKSLTKSTSPDSIWAMSSWLIIINVFTFDYGAGVEAKFPAPLSTNAALMASTVLASRLPSTTHVFSLTLFSIEVFGLFPVFRRHLRHVSRPGHMALTAALIVAAGAGLCVTITGGGWTAAVVGVVLGGLLTCLAMGMTSWWLIGLQRFKNEITGPWDPARPVIRRRWD